MGPVAFGLSKLNRVFLRSHCGAPVPVISMRVRLRQERQPGFASGLNGKEDAAVQHRSAVPGGWLHGHARLSWIALSRRRWGSAPFTVPLYQKGTPHHIKSSPASAGRAAYRSTGDNALYQQHRFPHSACTPRCSRCTERIAQR